MSYLLSLMETFDNSIGKLLIAAVLGGIIGWERERRGRPAGLRTHILVCVGVTLMMVVSEHIFQRYKTFAADSIIRVDPARIAAQVVTGIGFLGAGTIMRFKTTVRGVDDCGIFMGRGGHRFGNRKQLLYSCDAYNTHNAFCAIVRTSL